MRPDAVSAVIDTIEHMFDSGSVSAAAARIEPDRVDPDRPSPDRLSTVAALRERRRGLVGADEIGDIDRVHGMLPQGVHQCCRLRVSRVSERRTWVCRIKKARNIIGGLTMPNEEDPHAFETTSRRPTQSRGPDAPFRASACDRRASGHPRCPVSEDPGSGNQQPAQG